MNINELQGKHGVPLAQVLPLVADTEGLETMEFPTVLSRFEFDREKLQVKLLLPTDQGPRFYNVNFDGYEKAMRVAGFAESVIKKYPTDLMIEPLNWGFPRKMENVKAFIKGNELVAFVKPALEVVSIQRMLQIVDEVGGEGTLFERLDHNLAYTNCSALIPSISRRWDDERIPQVGDVVCGGLNFQTSLMGESPLVVGVYMYRLVCSNGMLSADQTFKWSRNTETVNQLEWFRGKVMAAKELVGHELHKIDHLITTTLDPAHRADIVTNLFAEYGLSERMRQLVLERLLTDPPRNMWDVVNAITSVANAEELNDNPMAIRRLQQIGGDITSKVKVCNACFHVSRD